MIQVFYALLLLLFAFLMVATLTRHLLDMSAVREEIRHQRANNQTQADFLEATRTEVTDVQLDLDLLEEELASLQQQRSCLQALDSSATMQTRSNDS